MKIFLLIPLFYLLTFNAFAAVILQYHHVSDTTPKSTSISPAQFEVHLQYLKDHNFTVVPLSVIITAVKKQQPLPDKLVAITFDDAYQDNITFAKPLLNKFNYPYTIFVNPSMIQRTPTSYLSWPQLKSLADEGVIIANHGDAHNSMARKPKTISEADWLAEYTQLLLKAENTIKEKTGQSWRYFAYPYGEYTVAGQQWLKQNDFVAFTQQSGAVGLSSNLTIIPRFPASQPYDKISGLRDKLNSLPFNITLAEENPSTIYPYKVSKSIRFMVEVDDFRQSQLNCYISGLGRQKIHWHEEDSFTLTYSADLPIGRVRANCTAPSISNPGRYYWFSQPWFVLKENGDWYAL